MYTCVAGSQKLEDACARSKQLEKEVEELRKQSQKSKGLAACSLFGLQQQQLSSAKSIQKLSLACGRLSLHSAIVQEEYKALLQQLAKCKQQHGESELHKVSLSAALLPVLHAMQGMHTLALHAHWPAGWSQSWHKHFPGMDVQTQGVSRSPVSQTPLQLSRVLRITGTPNRQTGGKAGGQG